MAHHFDIDDCGAETLFLTFPPEAIFALAERLASVRRLYGELPAAMQAPVRGTYTFVTITGKI